MPRTQARVVCETDHQFACVGIIAAHQHVAVDLMCSILEMRGGNILKRRDYFHRCAEAALQRNYRRFPIGQLHFVHLRRRERYRYVDENFSAQPRGDAIGRGKLYRIRHREYYHCGLRRIGVACTAHTRFAAEQLIQFRGARQGFACLARTDHHVVARERPAIRKPVAFLAGAAEYADVHTTALSW